MVKARVRVVNLSMDSCACLTRTAEKTRAIAFFQQACENFEKNKYFVFRSLAVEDNLQYNWNIECHKTYLLLTFLETLGTFGSPRVELLFQHDYSPQGDSSQDNGYLFYNARVYGSKSTQQSWSVHINNEASPESKEIAVLFQKLQPLVNCVLNYKMDYLMAHLFKTSQSMNSYSSALSANSNCSTFDNFLDAVLVWLTKWPLSPQDVSMSQVLAKFESYHSEINSVLDKKRLLQAIALNNRYSSEENFKKVHKI